MPFKSQAQRAKMIELEKQGKVKPGTVAKWEKETPKDSLPARIGPPSKKRRGAHQPATSYTKRRFGIK